MGLVFFAFPLHQPGKPDTKRADHLGVVTVPMLFLSGTVTTWPIESCSSPSARSSANGRRFIRSTPPITAFVCSNVLAQSEEDVFVEMARVVKEWAGRPK